MEMDDPSKPEFASPHSYNDFEKRVRTERRYATDEATRAFIQTVLHTAPPRITTLSKDQIVYRAQIGSDVIETPLEDGGSILECRGLGAERMTPIPDKVTDGRANPVGIAFLYLASSEKTAISEVRPWIGTEVSVARFRIARDLQLLDLSPGHGSYGILQLPVGYRPGKTPLDAETKRRAVWTDIDSAFSTPVVRGDNPLDYVPTQILAEAFREAGYDGVVYRSHFGDPGYNIALFDLSAAKAISCCPYRIREINIEYDPCGVPWSEDAVVELEIPAGTV